MYITKEVEFVTYSKSHKDDIDDKENDTKSFVEFPAIQMYGNQQENHCG